MKNYNGGYIMLDLASQDAYKQALVCAKSQKPVMVYDLDGKAKFVDEVVKIGDDVVIITEKGNILINEDGEVTSTSAVTDITAMESSLVESLECGDHVLKDTDGQKHLYVVSYKEHHVGICLTYTDASLVETVSYDYTGGKWVYNSTDSTPIVD